jgi:outer membrane protein assembly factor BamE (lipoprotein component of BamABCDE complex)
MGLLDQIRDFLFPSYDIDKIELGFTKAQVRAVFGKPDQIVKGSWLDEEWKYYIPFHTYVSIGFNRGGKVSKTYSSKD